MSTKTIRIALACLAIILANIACDSTGGTCKDITTCNPSTDVQSQPEFLTLKKANEVLINAFTP